MCFVFFSYPTIEVDAFCLCGYKDLNCVKVWGVFWLGFFLENLCIVFLKTI